MYDGTIKIDTKIDTTGAGKGFESLKSLASTACKAAVAAITAVAVALGGVAAASIKIGSSFEAEMSKVESISGATGNELEQLTVKAKEMGAKTKFSANESAEAFEYMAMAGWKTESMLGGIEGIMNLAAASGESLASVSDICTDAMTAFGLQASEAGHFADVLAKASSNSNTNVSMMGATFKYVAPIAGSMKYSIEDTATAIGLMANAGIKGEQAGTSLRAMLTRLVKPPKDAAEALDKLKISAKNADGTMRPLSDLTKELRTKFSKLSDSEKANYAASIAGTEAMSGLLAIVNASDDDFEKLSAAIADSDGAAESMAKTMQDNLQGAVEELTGGLETLGLEFYDSIKVRLKEAAQAGIGYVDQLTAAFQSGGLNKAVEQAGDIIASLATKAAQGAPKMVDTAVKFIKSFVDGISRNKSKLTAAATEIVTTLVKGLVSLLPSQVRKPVEETLKAIEKSFKSGGLKNAVETVSRVIQRLADVALSLGEAALPVLTSALDFLGNNLNWIVPLITAVYTGIKVWSIVSTIIPAIQAMAAGWQTAALQLALYQAANDAATISTATSTAALGLKEVVVGVLTGKVTLATAAQWAWNAAQNANPIGIAITAIAALAAGMTAFYFIAVQVKSAEDQWAESNQKLADSFSGTADAAKTFQDGVGTAKGVLDNFNDAIIVSNERQQEVSDRMDEVQTEISTIARNAAEERRSLTEQEIQRLQDLFAEMRKLSQQQLEIDQAYQQAVKDMAADAATDRDTNLADYQEYSQNLIASAEDTRDKTISAAEEQYKETLMLADQACTENGIRDEKSYSEKRKQAKADYDAATSEARQLYGDTLAIIEQGYFDRSTAAQGFSSDSRKYNLLLEQENQRNKDALEKINSDYSDIDARAGAKYANEIAARQAKIEAENNRHYTVLSGLGTEYSSSLDENTQEQVGALLYMAMQTELYGGKVSDETQSMIDAMLDAYEGMPEDAKSSMRDTMNGMLKGMQEKEPTLYQKASSIAGSILSKLRSVFDIHSPSKKTKKIFSQVMEGAESGMDEETPSLLKKTGDVGSGVLGKFRENASALVAKMRAGFAPVQIPAVAASNSSVAAKVDAATSKSKPQSGIVETHLDINGREFAVATTPYIEKQMAFK